MPTLSIDPYRVVDLTVAELSRVQPGIVFTGQQFGEAAILAAGLLAALGATPAA